MHLLLQMSSLFSALSLPKDKGALTKLVNKLAISLKRFVVKTVEALPAIIGSVAGAILSFLDKAVGFVAEHT